QRELTRLLAEANNGTLVEPSKVTVAEHLRSWLGHPPKEGEPIPPPPAGITPKTCERYRELSEGQIIPHLGDLLLQKLKPTNIAAWHDTLLKNGSKKGGPLAARTVGHAHRVLHRALERAVKTETVVRNVAAAISPPKVEDEADEIEILDEAQLADVVIKLQGHPLEVLVALGRSRSRQGHGTRRALAGGDQGGVAV